MNSIKILNEFMNQGAIITMTSRKSENDREVIRVVQLALSKIYELHNRTDVKIKVDGKLRRNTLQYLKPFNAHFNLLNSFQSDLPNKKRANIIDADTIKNLDQTLYTLEKVINTKNYYSKFPNNRVNTKRQRVKGGHIELLNENDNYTLRGQDGSYEQQINYFAIDANIDYEEKELVVIGVQENFILKYLGLVETNSGILEHLNKVTSTVTVNVAQKQFNIQFGEETHQYKSLWFKEFGEGEAMMFPSFAQSYNIGNELRIVLHSSKTYNKELNQEFSSEYVMHIAYTKSKKAYAIYTANSIPLSEVANLIPRPDSSEINNPSNPILEADAPPVEIPLEYLDSTPQYYPEAHHFQISQKEKRSPNLLLI